LLRRQQQNSKRPVTDYGTIQERATEPKKSLAGSMVQTGQRKRISLVGLKKREKKKRTEEPKKKRRVTVH